MTAANNLADLLSDILEDLQNKKPGSGKGKGKEGEELSLPDIIKKQKELIQKLKDGDKPGNTKGKITKEQLSGEQFQLYKEQSLLKEQLRDILQQHSIEGKQSIKILKQMEELEKLLLEKGINNESLQRMERLEYELLKLEEATFEQNKKKERKSDTNKEKRVQHSVKPLNIKNINLNEDEILIRQNIMLQPKYQKRIKVYFNSENQ
jgi:hypothetical protein